MSNYYYQTRNGVRVRVRKGRNRVRLHKGRKIARATVRGAIPTKKGEFYGKGAIVINARGKSIKEDEGLSIRRRKGVVVAAGKLGKIKGGIAIGYKKGREIEAIADYNNNPDTAEFAGYYTRINKEFPTLAKFAENSTHYRRRSKKGKITLVKKRKKRINPYLAAVPAFIGTVGGLSTGLAISVNQLNKFKNLSRPLGHGLAGLGAAVGGVTGGIGGIAVSRKLNKKKAR